MSKTDWYSVLILLLVPTIVVGIIISIMDKSNVSMAGYLISAILLSLYYTEHKQGGVMINMKGDKPTSGNIAIFVAGFIGGAIGLFIFLQTLAPILLAVLR